MKMECQKNSQETTANYHVNARVDTNKNGVRVIGMRWISYLVNPLPIRNYKALQQ